MKQLQLRTLLGDVQPDASRSFGAERRERWVKMSNVVGPLMNAIECWAAARGALGHAPPTLAGLWLQVPRESWPDVQAELEADDFDEESWLAEFPNETEWLHVTAEVVDGVWHVAHSGISGAFRLDPAKERVAGFYEPSDVDDRRAMKQYLTWFGTALTEQVDRFTIDSVAYAEFIEAQLPNRERLGRILRRDLWQAAPSTEQYIRDELRPDEVSAFLAIASQLETPVPLPTPVTSDDYLRFCATCYKGARYEGLAGLVPLEQYRRMADGRDDGLLELPGDSPTALLQWLDGGPRGGHPWEIARGGNTTHISLYLTRDPTGARLILEGSARSRAAETIRMALALTRAAIPFQLLHAKHLARMAEGSDWIGIVPDSLAARYAAHLFPAEHQVGDVINYRSIGEVSGAESKVVWYPGALLYSSSHEDREVGDKKDGSA